MRCPRPHPSSSLSLPVPCAHLPTIEKRQGKYPPLSPNNKKISIHYPKHCEKGHPQNPRGKNSRARGLRGTERRDGSFMCDRRSVGSRDGRWRRRRGAGRRRGRGVRCRQWRTQWRRLRLRQWRIQWRRCRLGRRRRRRRRLGCPGSLGACPPGRQGVRAVVSLQRARARRRRGWAPRCRAGRTARCLCRRSG